MRVLVVEDDRELGMLLAGGLAEAGFHVVLEATFGAGRSRVALGAFDLIVLDVMLPGGSGFDLCRWIPGRRMDTSVMMLTARDAVDDRVLGLDSGADDYPTKPFAMRELVARLHALARHRPAMMPEVVAVDDLDVDLRARSPSRLTVDGLRGRLPSAIHNCSAS